MLVYVLLVEGAIYISVSLIPGAFFKENPAALIPVGMLIGVGQVRACPAPSFSLDGFILLSRWTSRGAPRRLLPYLHLFIIVHLLPASAGAWLCAARRDVGRHHRLRRASFWHARRGDVRTRARPICSEWRITPRPPHSGTLIVFLFMRGTHKSQIFRHAPCFSKAVPVASVLSSALCNPLCVSPFLQLRVGTR